MVLAERLQRTPCNWQRIAVEQVVRQAGGAIIDGQKKRTLSVWCCRLHVEEGISILARCSLQAPVDLKLF